MSDVKPEVKLVMPEVKPVEKTDDNPTPVIEIPRPEVDTSEFKANERVPSDWDLQVIDEDRICATNRLTARYFEGTRKEFSEKLKG